jgi:cytochrome b561
MGLAIPFGTGNTLGCYLILFAQATTGAIASYLFWPVSVVHGVLSKVLLGLIVLHALAATSWHFFIERDGVMERMLYSRPFRNKCSRTVHSGP